LLITNFDKVVSSVKNFLGLTDENVEKQKELTKGYRAQQAAIEAQIASQQRLGSLVNDAFERQITLQEAAGQDASKIRERQFQEQQRFIENQIKSVQKLAELELKSTDRTAKRYTELVQQTTDLQNNLANITADFTAQTIQEARERTQKEKEEQEKRVKDEQDASAKRLAILKDAEAQRLALFENSVDQFGDFYTRLQRQAQAFTDSQLKAASEAQVGEINSLTAIEAARTESFLRQSAVSEQLNEETRNFALSLNSDTLAAINQLGVETGISQQAIFDQYFAALEENDTLTFERFLQGQQRIIDADVAQKQQLLANSIQFGDQLGNILADSIQNGELQLENFSRGLTILILDTLQRQIVAAIAGAIAQEIGTKGVAGIVTAGIATGLVNAAFNVAFTHNSPVTLATADNFHISGVYITEDD
jgi:hypothetical protein